MGLANANIGGFPRIPALNFFPAAFLVLLPLSPLPKKTAS